MNIVWIYDFSALPFQIAFELNIFSLCSQKTFPLFFKIVNTFFLPEIMHQAKVLP